LAASEIERSIFWVRQLVFNIINNIEIVVILLHMNNITWARSASEMTYIVSGGALNSTNSTLHSHCGNERKCNREKAVLRHHLFKKPGGLRRLRKDRSDGASVVGDSKRVHRARGV